MKKLAILAIGIAASFGANATPVPEDSGEITPANACSLLTEGVRINLSTGTIMNYACNADDNGIGLAACNTLGRKQEITVQGPPATEGGAPTEEKRTGGTFYMASSHGGSISSDGGVCAAATLETAAVKQALLPENRK